MNFISNHKIAVAVVTVLLIVAAWYEFAQSPSAPVISTTTATDPQDATLVSTLVTLQAVSLSGTILSDPGFLSLKDFTTQVVSEPVGRPNPFAPLSAGALQGVTSAPVNPNLFAPSQHSEH